jgi:hypothetical protein
MQGIQYGGEEYMPDECGHFAISNTPGNEILHWNGVPGFLNPKALLYCFGLGIAE